MAAPVKQRFTGVKDFLHGSAEHNTIKEVEWSDETEQLADSGDVDTCDTFLEEGKSTVTGSLMISDPVQAYALRARVKSDVTFKGKAPTGGTDCTVTLKGVKFFSVSPRFMHNGVAVSRMTFRAHDAAGGTVVTVVAA